MFTYKDAQDYLEIAKKKGSVLGLETMQVLMQELGNPQKSIPTVHIAGTNGKGSVGAYLASICKEAGFKVGRYCSPAVFHSLECWQYDGENITEEEYASGMSIIKEACDAISIREGIAFEPTSFELETALAFVYMAQKQPDVFLLEVGMGGAEDATNVVEHPIATVFTQISRDHMQFLGESLSEIAEKKAGIMKKGCLAFWGEQEPEVSEVLKAKCEAIGAVRGAVYTRCIEFLSQEPGKLCFSYLGVEYQTQMSGLYQIQNATLAIAVFDAIWQSLLFGLPIEEINEDEIPVMCILDMEYACKLGVAKAQWKGRFEVLSKEPLFIVDGAHNTDAVKQLTLTVEKSFTNPRLNLIIGILADKEHEKMLEPILPFANKVFTITPPNPRGLSGAVLAEEIRPMHKEVMFCETIKEAVDKALASSKQEGCPILAFGSLSYLGELEENYKQICESRIENV